MSPADARPTRVRWTRSSRALAWGALAMVLGMTTLFWSTQSVLASIALWALGAVLGIDAVRSGFFFEGAGSIWIEDGALHVRRGRNRWVLRGESLVGASSSRGSGGWDITLQARRQLPLTLKDLDEDSVQRICEVLGIGAAGFGTLSFRRRSSTGQTALATVLGIMGTYMLMFSAAMPAGYYGVMMLPFALLLLLVGRGREPIVSLADEGLGIVWFGRRVTIPWQSLNGVQRTPNSLMLQVVGQPTPIVLPIRRVLLGEALAPVEADLVEAQAWAAIERTRGRGRPRVVDATGTSEMLGRGSLTSPEWHAHLDRLAAEMAHGGGYRSVRIDRDVLHRVLGNPDAEPTARVGAARVLARVEGERARERIEIARASLHDDADIQAFEDALAELESEPAARRQLG